MTTFQRVHLVVLDSAGIGEAPDAADFDDYGVDTLGHIAEATDGLNMPHMGRLGLSNIKDIQGIAKQTRRWHIIRKCRRPPAARIR